MADTQSDTVAASLLHGWAVGTTRPCVYPGKGYDDIVELALERAAAALHGRECMLGWLPIEVEGVLLSVTPLAETYLVNNGFTPSPTVAQFTGNVRTSDRIHLLQLVFTPSSVEGKVTHLRSSPRGQTFYRPGSVGWNEGGLAMAAESSG